jgi:hypothetical protein
MATARHAVTAHGFNLSITAPEVIERTHERMRAAYHPAGGPWRREYMPRTTFVFLNGRPGLSPERQRAEASAEARRDNDHVIDAMTAMVTQVVPRLRALGIPVDTPPMILQAARM